MVRESPQTEHAPRPFSDARPGIRRLAEGTINRIAAGEGVERPASAVKELGENGGCGMDAEDLALAVLRHATSKLPFAQDGADDLSHIGTLGFRGEALPSIGSVAKLAITTRTATGEGCTVTVTGGDVS